MGAGGRTEASGGAGAEDNVIRFPRDWIGSKDDLIPIGPAADRLQAEAEARRAAGTEAQPASEPEGHETTGDPGFAEAMNAEDFWGEGAGALHQPVEAPRPAEPGSGARVLPLPTIEDADSPTIDDADSDFGGFPEWRPPRRGLGLPRAGVAVFALLLLAAVAMLVISRGAGHGHVGAALRSATVQRNASAQRDTSAGPDPLVTLAWAAAGASAAGLKHLAPAKPHGNVQRRAGSHPRVGAHRFSGARRSAGARRTDGAQRSTSRAQVSSTPPAGGSAVAGGSTAPGGSASGDVSNASSSAPPPSTSSAGSSESSVAATSGPATLGGVVGSQCNVQCSATGN